MNVTKQAITSIHTELQKRDGEIRSKLSRNRYAIRKLADEQRVMKKQLGELRGVMNYLDGRLGLNKKDKTNA